MYMYIPRVELYTCIPHESRTYALTCSFRSLGVKGEKNEEKGKNPEVSNAKSLKGQSLRFTKGKFRKEKKEEN